MNVFLLEIRNICKGIISSTVSICGVIIFMLMFFPSMQTESMKALAGAKLEGIDPAILEALGLTNMIDFTIITNYFGYAMQFITLAIMIVVTQRAVGLLYKEEADGTIEYLCSKPVSRSEVFFQKGLAHIASILIMIFAFTLVTVVGYLQVTEYTFAEAVNEAIILFGGVLFVALIFSAIGILVSAILKGVKGVGGISLAIVLGTFIIGICSALIESLDFLKWLSPMDWIKTAKLMTEGILPEEWIVGIIVIIGCTVAAWVRYDRKDLLI
ncbi:MAG: ABC transporter permease subunit [Eubacteriales bacterium]|nr:ABC transporter permease subunit [Eubacteriales bacterium]